MTADSLRFFFLNNMYNSKHPMVTAVAIHTLSSIQMDKIYKITAAVISLKSPLEKEKRMIKVKQHTMAGPRSPRIKNNKIVATIANNAKKKNENLLPQVVYSEINFSLTVKKPARKKNDEELNDLTRLKT